MEHRTLGKTGIQVSVQCLGAMMFGLWGNRDHDDSIAIIHHALDNGINFVDTADVYSQGESEEIVGKALQGPPRRRRARHQGARPDGRGREPRRATRAAGSATRSSRACAGCDTDYIDLYQIHRPDPTIDVEETLSVLTDLVREGKVRAIGSSTFPAEADRRGAMGRRAPRLRALPLRAAAVFDPRRGIERAVLPPVSATAWA